MTTRQQQPTQQAQVPHAAQTEPSLMHKVAAASFGAVLTSLAVTPLDVVKTRMQAARTDAPVEQAACAGKHHHRCRSCGVVIVSDGLMDHCLTPKCGGRLYQVLTTPIRGDHTRPRIEAVKPSMGFVGALLQVRRTEGIG